MSIFFFLRIVCGMDSAGQDGFYLLFICLFDRPKRLEL